MGSFAPRIQPIVLREDRIAERLARVMYRYQSGNSRFFSFPRRKLHFFRANARKTKQKNTPKKAEKNKKKTKLNLSRQKKTQFPTPPRGE